MPHAAGGHGATGVSDSQRDGDAAAAWATSGLAALTGRRDGPPLGGPRALVEGVRSWADQLTVRSAKLGAAVVVDPLALLAERATLSGLVRGGDVSCGGGSRLLATTDGWVAVSLARQDDWELVAAWLGRPGPVAEGDWETVADGVAGSDAGQLRAGAALLGLPAAVLGERERDASGTSTQPGADGPGGIHGIRARRIRPAPAVRSCADLLVVDLSSLWAGPLAGRLLRQAGARVVKVESTRRPDGARLGPPRFFSRLNGGKASVALDLTSATGRRQLGELVAGADVVITGSRPRALEQLGLDVEDAMAVGRTRLWLSVTGYGTEGASGMRVAFGDDAAVAGGLVARDGRGPCFLADAVADPLCGLASAVAALTALADGGAWVIDASMADIAGGLTGPPVSLGGHTARPPPDPVDAQEPEARALGADTATVLSSLARA